MINAKSREGLLSSFRILDLTDELGFLCGKILGDLGADVVKVDRPGGDPARLIGPFYQDQIHPEKSLCWFALTNTKRGITWKLDRPRVRATFAELVAQP